MTTQSVGERFHEFGLADRIRVAREANGWTQDQLAELTRISRQTISNYETGVTRRVNHLYLRAIAEATGFSLRWLADSGTIEVSYAVTGGDSGPNENTFTIEGGTASFDKEESVDTASSGTKLKVKVTDVSYSE